MPMGVTLTAWQEQNPLRQWRLAQPPEGWKRSVLARQLEVSHTAVASWENGMRLPMVDAIAKIEKLTGITATQWMDWYNRKPQKT
jgi:ribosome-binding protein aMBF1 (putative translation factor)